MAACSGGPLLLDQLIGVQQAVGEASANQVPAPNHVQADLLGARRVTPER